jgi:oligopeptidase B
MIIGLDMPTNQPRSYFSVIIPRQDGVIYNVASHGNYFYIHTNEGGAKNYKVIKAPVDDPANKELWEEVLPHRSGVLVDNIMLFRHHFVAFEWDNCVQKIRVQDLSDGGTISGY